MIERWRNENGTFNGIKMMSDLSGRPEAEVAWIAERVKTLMAEGKTKDQIKTILDDESKSEPWMA